MSIINSDDILDNIENWTDNEDVIARIKFMTHTEIEEYFEDFLDYEAISDLCDDAYNNGIFAMEHNLN